MSKSIEREIEDFLFDLGTFQEGIPDKFEEFAKTRASLLWGKLVMFPEDSSIGAVRSCSARFRSVC